MRDRGGAAHARAPAHGLGAATPLLHHIPLTHLRILFTHLHISLTHLHISLTHLHAISHCTHGIWHRLHQQPPLTQTPPPPHLLLFLLLLLLFYLLMLLLVLLLMLLLLLPPPSSQLFELLLALSGSARFQKFLRPVLPEMAYITISYMQVGQYSTRAWGLHQIGLQ